MIKIGDSRVMFDANGKAPITFASYAISYRGGHAHVRIEQETFKDLKAYCLEHACHWSPERLEKTLRVLRFEPYAPVRPSSSRSFGLSTARERPLNWSLCRRYACACDVGFSGRLKNSMLVPKKLPECRRRRTQAGRELGTDGLGALLR